VQGGILVLAALLVGVGCKLPWISADGMPFLQAGITPPLNEIWPIAVGAALLLVLGLAAVADPERTSRAGWLIGLLVVVGIGALTYPHYRDITREISSYEPDFGISLGFGMWVIGIGIIAGLVGCASGWGSAARARK
jgi:hypothetical protein